MNILADRYQFRARMIPEFLTVLPLVILLVASVKDLLVLGFLSFALFIIFFQGHFSSKFGRKLEEKLLKEKKLEWDSDFLCKLHETDENNQYILLLESAAQKSGKASPFSFDEPHEKTRQIGQVIAWIREQTRDSKNFPTVFDKNCDYGFYRNMLGMKCCAFWSMMLAIFFLFLPTLTIQTTPTLCVDIFYPLLEKDKLIVRSVWFLLAIAWIIFWAKVISIEALNEASEGYIKTLLKAVEGIDSEKESSSKEFAF